MGCRVCAFLAWLLWALLMNALVLLDVALNFFPLLGRVPETVSQRLSRLRDDKDAKYNWLGVKLCGWLTAIGKLLGADRDHCTWAASADGHDGVEILPWSK